MPFAASNKSVVKAVKSPMARMGRFIQTRRTVGQLPATNPRQSVRTSVSNPARSVGTLRGGDRVK